MPVLQQSPFNGWPMLAAQFSIIMGAITDECVGHYYVYKTKPHDSRCVLLGKDVCCSYQSQKYLSPNSPTPGTTW